ncbi:MAG: glucoamylase family protein [Bacteroidota bacterium]
MCRSALFMLTFMVLFSVCGISANPREQTDSTRNIPLKFSLEELEYRTFRYFWDLADTTSGLIPERWPTQSFSSIAATGFGLSAYLVGVDQGYITRKEAAARVLKTLGFFWHLPQGPDKTGVGGYKGLFYRFLDMRTGMRFKDAELSTIGTGLLMAGILSCLQYFDGEAEDEAGIRNLAEKLYRRVDWNWALDGKEILSMGWHPESGFIPGYWYGYNEAMVLVIMAIGSPTHPIPASCWKAWTSGYNWSSSWGFAHVNFGPLYGHQYSHIYIDFKGIKDEYMQAKGIDYFENSRRATYAQQAYCRANPGQFAGYGKDLWGLTACDGPGYAKTKREGNDFVFDGYSARGIAAGYHVDDGTLAPAAAGGSLPFAPEICIPALETMYNTYGQSLYQKYGFKDAFNPSFTDGKGNEKGWFDVDYLGIDQGPILLMIGNNRSGLIWNLMKRNIYIVQGLKKAGFKGGWLGKN